MTTTETSDLTTLAPRQSCGPLRAVAGDSVFRTFTSINLASFALISLGVTGQPPLTHLNPVRRAGGVGSLQDEVDAVVDEVLLVDLSEAADGEVAANERMARLHPDNSDNRMEMSLQAG